MAEHQPLSDDERADLVAYLDGELRGPPARDIEARLNRDPRVRAEAEALKRSYDLLDYLPRPAPSASFTERTMTRASMLQIPPARDPRRGRPWVLGFGWAAALVLAGMVGYASVPVSPKLVPTAPDVDPLLARDLQVIERLRPYQRAGDITFLHELDRPELFGDDHSGL